MRSTRFVRVAICVLWLASAGTGFGLLLKYEQTPGGDGKAAPTWPAGTRVKLDTRRNTLLLFAHPRCPCTRATMEELNRLLAKTEDGTSAQVWFYEPDDSSAEWSQTDLWRSAAAIPGVLVQGDTGGRQASLFGAETSGTVLLYAANGQLLFKGGITAGRGHAGDNAGENAIIALAGGQTPPLRQTPVYGCSLSGCKAPILP